MQHKNRVLPPLSRLFVIGLALFSWSSICSAGPVANTLFYTTYQAPTPGSHNVGRVQASYNGNGFSSSGSFTLSNDTAIASLPTPVGSCCGGGGADGIVMNPNNGKLLVGSQGSLVYEVNPTTGAYTSADATVPALHLAVDHSKNFVWASFLPGKLSKVSINPFGSPGTVLVVTGSTTIITSIAFSPSGQAYYTNAPSAGNGTFGTIDLTTGVTTQLLVNVQAAHGMIYDPFTNTMVLGGDSHITQVSLAGSILSDLDLDPFSQIPGFQLDQGTVDGQGHVFWASNNGNVVFVDYSNTGLVGSSLNFVHNQFFRAALDDFAPLIGPGGTELPEPQTLVLVVIALLSTLLSQRITSRLKRVSIRRLSSTI